MVSKVSKNSILGRGGGGRRWRVPAEQMGELAWRGANSLHTKPSQHHKHTRNRAFSADSPLLYIIGVSCVGQFRTDATFRLLLGVSTCQTSSNACR